MTPDKIAEIQDRFVRVANAARDDALAANECLYDIPLLLEEVMRLRASEDEYVVLSDRLSELLTQTADALKGPPPPLGGHDWSDLPTVAAKLVEHHKTAHHMGLL